jgi:hypothetical protein
MTSPRNVKVKEFVGMVAWFEVCHYETKVRFKMFLIDGL